ncbi:MAG: hypothetical protein ACFFD4_33120 [Candidatus Odinarchaeota archaeon]
MRSFEFLYSSQARKREGGVNITEGKYALKKEHFTGVVPETSILLAEGLPQVPASLFQYG